MELRRLLEQKKTLILKEWISAIFETYTDDTGEFFRDELDMFANPVGHTLRASTQNILEGLIAGNDAGTLASYAEEIIRVRAVQDLFIEKLKTVITSHLKPEIHKYQLSDGWDVLLAVIDDLSLLAYEKHRVITGQIQSIRLGEIEKRERFLTKVTESRIR
jgi:hypothetical protein